ncbi:alpha/beta hydrolase [Aquabacterium sp. J223]|uniref:alpha/beta hydrolase n=1 Tax=Aquabacterium sp. J223 TaxID=2898431 RepID=UPI0021AE040A|nr:alpha/beta hydrolase [Aquabacterium sp. J223]UUX95299.1 alpha/beta hydrolase [Aquabacterium sp. J223]
MSDQFSLRLRAPAFHFKALSLAVILSIAGCGGGDDDAPALAQILGCNGTVTYDEVEGTLPGGTPWGMRRPTNWNGVLINDLDYIPRKDSAQNCYWLQRGYGLSGTNRHPQRNNIYDPERETTELLSVMDSFTQRYGKPTRTIQYGHSGGGYVALNFAERYPNRVDGVVAGCAHEPVVLMNMMHDGWYVLRTLLAPQLQILNFDALTTVSSQAQQWRTALTQAQATPAGKARIALASAIGQWAPWTDTTKPKPNFNDPVAFQQAIFETAIVNSSQPGGQSRYMFEHAGGSATARNLSWNSGIDYGQLFNRAEPATKALVESLYAASGTTLQADLATLGSTQRVQADPGAIDFWNQPGRIVRGRPQVPVLRTHTTGDHAVPPTIIDSYTQKMQANQGNTALYRTAIVDRTGHCTFDASEAAASVEVLLERISTGTWPDTTPAAMNARAKSLFPSSTPLFVAYQPVSANRPQNNPSGGL